MHRTFEGVIVRIELPELIEQLRRTGQVPVRFYLGRLYPGQPSFSDNWYNVRVSNVKVSLEGAKTRDDWISLLICHNGISRFWTKEKREVEFTHKPILNSWKYNNSTREEVISSDLGGEEGYS